MSNSTAAQLQRGVIVEFDFAVLPGHALLSACCRSRLEKEGISVDAKLMARHFWGRSFSSGLNGLCNKLQKTVAVPAVVADCNAAFAEALAGKLTEVPRGFVAFVKALIDKGIKVVLISRVESEAVRAVFAGLPEDKLVIQHDTSVGFGFYSWDGWRRAARKNDLYERLSVAVAGSGFSVKGALTSGMGVFVKENPETSYQDISGSDVCVGEFSAALVDDVCRILRI